jgi:hypothetical protein
MFVPCSFHANLELLLTGWVAAACTNQLEGDMATANALKAISVIAQVCQLLNLAHLMYTAVARG